MAFPFARAPSFEELIADLIERHGCRLRILDGFALKGPRGDVVIQYLERTVGERLLTSEPLPTYLADRVSPDSLRRLIVQLQLPKSVWVWAGDPYDPASWNDDQNCH